MDRVEAGASSLEGLQVEGHMVALEAREPSFLVGPPGWEARQQIMVAAYLVEVAVAGNVTCQVVTHQAAWLASYQV